MRPVEPAATALFLATFGLLLGVAVASSRASERTGVPLAPLFLLLGMAAGSEGIGGIAFDDYAFAFRLGTAALVLILFDGGLNTPFASVRRAIAPAGVLATVGVVGTAALVAWAGHALGFPWPLALVLGAVVSSTDAAAVFAVLRGSGLHLQKRVGSTLELESGLNDPMAVVLTAELTATFAQPGALAGLDAGAMLLRVLLHIVVGVLAGLAIGYGARAVLARVRLSAGGLYPALTLAIACLAFGVPTLAGGSGFLAVYVTALVLGNGELPYRSGLLRVHDALAWLSQIAMFLVLGMLVYPSRLWDAAWPGLLLAVFIAVAARPAVVAACLVPFRYPLRDIALIGWVGLRGAVPIVLATMPVLAQVPGAERLFDVVFFLVLVNVGAQGATVPWVTRKLGLEVSEPPTPPAVLQIETLRPLDGEVLSFYVDEALAVVGVPLADLPFPERAAVTLLVRGDELIAPKGDTTLQPGDHAYVFARREDRPFIQLLLGRPEGG